MNPELLGEQLHADCRRLLGDRGEPPGVRGVRTRGVPALGDLAAVVVTAVSNPVVVHVFSALIAHGIWHVVERKARLERLRDRVRAPEARLDSRPLLNEADQDVRRDVVSADADTVDQAARSALNEVRDLLVMNGTAPDAAERSAAEIADAVARRIKARVVAGGLPTDAR